MKIVWLKKEGDSNSFIFFEKIGLNVISLDKPDDVDNKMRELIQNNYNTIFLSNELAGFSEDIIKKYRNNENINIIISRRK